MGYFESEGDLARHGLIGSSAPRATCGARFEGGAQDDAPIVFIDERTLFGDCVSRSIANALGREVLAVTDVQKLLELSDLPTPALVVLCPQEPIALDNMESQITHLIQAFGDVPVVVMADTEHVDKVRTSIASGAKGYIPTSVGLEVAVEAIRLVKAGGTFIPASSIAPKPAAPGRAVASRQILTERQLDVVKALRRGNANKIIAYELNMKESTVKVHLRNIMKKLNAKNRTEVAMIASAMVEEARSS